MIYHLGDAIFENFANGWIKVIVFQKCYRVVELVLDIMRQMRHTRILDSWGGGQTWAS